MQRWDVLKVSPETVAKAAVAPKARTDELPAVTARRAIAGHSVPLALLPPQLLVAGMVCMWTPST